MDRLLAMKVFSAVVDAGSFSRAARQLNLSATAVSRHVQQLEEALGAALLQRTTRRLSLTETGAIYYERCRQILADVAEAEAQAASAEAQPRGVLRLSLPYSFGLRYVSPLLPKFRAAYPQLSLDVSFADRMVDLVEEGVDMALRITRSPGTTLVARALAPVRIVCCAAPAYLARRGVPATPEALRDHDCLIYSYVGDGWRFLAADGSECSVQVRGPLRANSGEVLADAAVAGEGIVLQPTFLVADALRDGRLVPILADWRIEESVAYAVYLPGLRRTARVQAMVGFLRGAFAGDDPPWDRSAAG
jgi:DNA-binding transcriptional LysR family regulator